MAVEARDVQTRRFTVAEFNRMDKLGLFDTGPRVELVEGEIIEMSPIGSRHASIVAALNELLVQRLRGRAFVWPQNPAIMDRHNEPVPDLLLARPRSDRYARGVPRPEDIALVVEVSDTTVRHDTTKMQVYSRNGIPEAWMVLVKRETIRVCTDPMETRYRVSRDYVRGESIPLSAFPDVLIAVDEILPPLLDDELTQE